MLDELVAVIDTLKSRIEAHRVTLQANETRTRVSLIDPLICVLGWDTADPPLITLEYEVGGKRADYGLLSADGDALVFLEAKRLGESLSNHRSQVVAYASEVGIRYLALTNGDQWKVYDNSKLVPIADRRILNLSLDQDPTPKIALQLLLLWRANMASGSAQPAQEPIVGITYTPNPLPERVKQVPPIVKETMNPHDAQQLSSTKMPGPGEGWTSMEKFRVVEGTKRPASMRFENDDERPFSRWNRVIVEVAEYLVRRDILTSDKCPIAAGSRSKRRLISAEPRHPSGRGFSNSLELSNGLYVELGFSARDCVKMSKYLLEHFGQDPAQVWLKTG